MRHDRQAVGFAMSDPTTLLFRDFLDAQERTAVMRAMGERNVGPGVNGALPAGLSVDL